MLETIREYAEDMADALRDRVDVRERHLQWLLTLAETAEPHLHGENQIEWLQRLDVELDNLRVGLAWLLHARDSSRALALVSWIWPFMDIRGFWVEGRLWVEAVLDLAGDKRDRRVRKALVIAGTFARHAHEFGEAERLLQEGLEMLGDEGTDQEVAWALQGLAAVALERGAYDAAEQYLSEAAAALRLADSPGALANLTGNRADLALRRGDGRSRDEPRAAGT